MSMTHTFFSITRLKQTKKLNTGILYSLVYLFFLDYCYLADLQIQGTVSTNGSGEGNSTGTRNWIFVAGFADALHKTIEKSPVKLFKWAGMLTSVC